MARARGEGGLRYREDRGLWVGTWQGREVTSRSRTEAARKLKALRDGDAPPTRQTVGDYLQWWVDEHLPMRQRLGKITGSTVDFYRDKAAHLTPPRRAGGVGDVRLAKLTDRDVERVLAHLLDRGLSPRTVQMIWGTLRTALNLAVKRKLLTSNPATLVEAPTVRPKRVEPLTPAQARAVIAALEGDRLRPLYVVGLALGLRISELLGLTWEDVDLDRGAVRIRHHLVRRAGGWSIGDTKGHRDDTLAIPGFAVDALREQRRAQAAERLAAGPAWVGSGALACSDCGTSELVYRRADGQPIHATSINKHVLALCDRAGVPRFTPHELLRHGAATLLRQHGAPLEDIADLLRHSRISTTQIYAHVTEDLRRRTADRLDDLLG